jgi:HK97 family phage major capsid protein
MSNMTNSLREARNAAVKAAQDLLAADPTSETLDAVEARHAEIVDLDAKIETAAKLEERAAQIAESRQTAGVQAYTPAAVVKSEPLTYQERGDYSFVKDMIRAHTRNDINAWDRLARHDKEVAVETRAITTSDGSGSGGAGEFVPPLWLINEYAEFARAARVTADLLTTMALPAGTDSINIPQITTGSRTGLQAGNNTSTTAPTTNRDLVTNSATAPVRTIQGYEEVSIQLVEQSPLAGGFDRLILGDLMADYNLQLNSAVTSASDGTSNNLNGLLNAAGQSITWTEASPTVANGIKAIAQAISGIVNNRYRQPEALVLHPKTWYWLASAVDSQNRPLVVPTAGGPMNTFGVNESPGAAAGYVGTILGVPTYLDATIPLVSTTQQPILVGRFSDSYLFESGVRSRVLTDVLSANLTVRFQVYGYVALAHRFANSIAKITGTGTVPVSGF